MPTCVKCGSELPDDAAFCPNCATPRASSAADPAPTYDAGLASLSGLETVVPSGPVETFGQSVLQEGEEFHGRYTVERKLGEGAMGVVYLALDKVTNRQVALKLINPALVKSASAVQRFVREGLTSRDIRHPNVIAMYDVGDDQGQLYLVMEYLEGETLRRWLHRTIQANEDVPYATARDLVVKILEGLAAAHDTGVIHRDLKPENIMLIGDPAAGDYKLKILDFGIARAIDAGPSTLTSTGTATGTPLYMAPEQRTAADTVGPSADLYAVSAIFFELLMGVPPEGRLGQPSKERRDVPAAADAIIETGLSSRPRSRYQSVSEYLAALQGAANAAFIHDQKSDKDQQDNEDRKEGKTGYWGRLSSGQRRTAIGAGVVVLLILGIIGEEESGLIDPDPIIYDPVPSGFQQPAVIEQPVIQEQRPVVAAASSVGGRWYDQVYGIGFAHAYVDITQQGNSVKGTIYDMQDNRVGTMSGRMNGSNLSYSYNAYSGLTGKGTGVLRPDATHMDVFVTDGSTGASESHILHKGHQPH